VWWWLGDTRNRGPFSWTAEGSGQDPLRTPRGCDYPLRRAHQAVDRIGYQGGCRFCADDISGPAAAVADV